MKLTPKEPFENKNLTGEITDAQIDYITALGIDLCFDLHTRNTHISHQLVREIKYLDELTKQEASDIISYFKSLKDSSS